MHNKASSEFELHLTHPILI